MAILLCHLDKEPSSMFKRFAATCACIWLAITTINFTAFASSTCDVQPSSIAVAVGENFTINCTFSCDESYITVHWLTQDNDSIFDVLPSGNRETYETQTCGSSNTGNRTHELRILASNELRTVVSIVCAVEYEIDMPCIASTCVEVLDEGTDINSNSTISTDAAENSCDFPQVINVTRGEWTTINCTISCDTPPETVHWLVLNNTESIFNVVPQSTAIARDPPESCNTFDVLVFQLLLKATIESNALHIHCIASVVGGGDICVTSTVLNTVEEPSKDIDECTLNTDGCDHTCTNTIGSYVCGCRSGYTLAADRHSCKEFHITAIPRPQTVAISSNQETQEHAVFTCTAVGISPPMLTWNHNQITASNSSKYQITSIERLEADGRHNVTSKLTIVSFNADDSGFVTCRVENSQESESTQIAVLGKPDESEVEITMDGNVTLVIRFPSKIPAIMKLEVTFTDIEDNNPVQRNSTISESEYPNTALIRHHVDSSDVPQWFTVSVRVLVETESGPIFGPEINFGGIEYPKIISSDNGMSTVIISTSVVFSTLAVIIVVILFVFMGACLVHKHMRKQVDLNSQDTNTGNSGNDYVNAFELELMESRQQSVAIECTNNVEIDFYPPPDPENPTTTECNNCDNASVQSIGDLAIFTKQMLGSGAFGCVFKGKLKQQDCAVKVLNPLGMQFISSLPSTSVIQQEALERFTKECEFLQSLDHENIVHHIDTRIHPESNLPLLVIELLDCTLKQYLYNCSEDLLPDHTQLSLSCDIASAMKFLHEHNIIHRDLCGDNILIKLTENNNNVPIAKVADFGMSRIIDCSTITHTLTALGHRVGYLPPEASLISQTRYDSGLDVFMFGVVMIQVVTKTPHVKSVEERLELIDQIADAHPLKDIILKCLHEESDKRPHMSETSKNLSTIYNQQRYQWIESVL